MMSSLPSLDCLLNKGSVLQIIAHLSTHLTGACEILRKQLRIRCGRHEDDLDARLGPCGSLRLHKVAQQQQQEVRVQAALVNLVHHDVGHSLQLGVAQEAPQKDSCRVARGQSSKQTALLLLGRQGR